MRTPLRVCVPVVLGLLVVAALYVLMALDYRGVPGLGAGLFAAAFLLLAGASAWICLPARSTVAPDTARVRGSVPLAVMVSAAVVLGIGGVVAWGSVLVTETGRGGFTVGGRFLLVVVGALGALGAVWRVATGRSTLPRIDLDDTGLHYRGGRTRRSLAWAEIASVALGDRHRRLVVRPRAGDAKPLRIPTAVFDVPPTRLLAVVESARARHGGPPRQTSRNPRLRGG